MSASSSDYTVRALAGLVHWAKGTDRSVNSLRADYFCVVNAIASQRFPCGCFFRYGGLKPRWTRMQLLVSPLGA